MGQLELTAYNPGSRNRTCPSCKRTVRRVWTGEVGATQVDIDPQPTTRIAALTAVLDGTAAVVAKTTKRDRGAGTTTTYVRLNQSTIGSSFLAVMAHHIAHRCGVTNPPPPPTTAELDYPATPPF